MTCLKKVLLLCLSLSAVPSAFAAQSAVEISPDGSQQVAADNDKKKTTLRTYRAPSETESQNEDRELKNNMMMKGPARKSGVIGMFSPNLIVGGLDRVYGSHNNGYYSSKSGKGKGSKGSTSSSETRRPVFNIGGRMGTLQSRAPRFFMNGGFAAKRNMGMMGNNKRFAPRAMKHRGKMMMKDKMNKMDKMDKDNNNMNMMRRVLAVQEKDDEEGWEEDMDEDEDEDEDRELIAEDDEEEYEEEEEEDEEEEELLDRQLETNSEQEDVQQEEEGDEI